MIIVEVEVPMMDKQYDFQIDGEIPLKEVKSEIIAMICQKEQCLMEGDAEMLFLWDAQSKVRLSEEKTAVENGLLTGSRILML